MIAWSAEVFAFARVNHQPIRRNERNPTPSHPINIWKRLLEEMMVIIASKNIARSRQKFSMYGSEAM